MTHHARERLAERAPGIAPSAALKQIEAAIADGKAYGTAQTVSGERVYEVRLSTGQIVFPLVAIDGPAVKTVLVEGMSLTTPGGIITLERRGLGTGVHQMDEDVYHADPAPRPSLSSTIAKILLAQSPLHAWTASPRLNPEWKPKDSTTFDVGRAAHRETLGAGKPYVAIPDELLSANGSISTKAAKEFVAEVRERGETPLKSDQVAQIEAMAAKIRAKLVENQIDLDPAHSEVVALAKIEGAHCRAMIDNAPADPRAPLYDFKTTMDASPEAAMRSIMNYGYDVQAAHYLDTWKAATGEDRLFRFIFQEKEAPYEVAVIEVGPDSLAMGRKKIRRAREMWVNCTEADNWPGYPAGVHRIELPEFFHSKWLERESVEADFKSRTGVDILDASRQWQSPENYRHAGE